MTKCCETKYAREVLYVAKEGVELTEEARFRVLMMPSSIANARVVLSNNNS